MGVIRRSAIVLGFVGLGVMTSCTKTSDALVENPCTKTAVVKLSSAAVAPKDPSGWAFTVTVPGMHALLVQNAFVQPADPPVTHTAEIDFEGQSPALLPIQDTGELPVKVMVPFSVCPN